MLLVAIRNSDQHAFEYLVKKYQSRVYNVCLSFIKNQEDADDLAQEVFMSFYENINDFRGDSAISTWLYRLAVNKSLEEIRRRKTKKRWSHLLSLWSKEEELGEQDWVHPGVMLENKELAALLFKKIDMLPENQKVAFMLQKVEGLSMIEIANILKATPSAVESTLSRAKVNLQKMLASYYKNHHE